MKHIKGNTYYYDSIVTQGAYRSDNEWLIIDTGNDDSNAKKSIKTLVDPKIPYIFNTHSHADHCGGNHYFVKKFNSQIIAPTLEHAFIEDPILEVTYLYGASAPKEMKNKFLFAKASRVSQRVRDASQIELEFSNEKAVFKLLDLPGHSPNMKGIVTPDNIAFLGDALLGDAFLGKHPLLFTFNVAEHLATIESLKNLSADAFVLSHGAYVDSIDDLIRKNKAAMLNVSYMMLEQLAQDTLTFDQLHQRLFKLLNLKENLSINQLNRSVLKAHATYLQELGDLNIFTESGQVLINKQ